MWLKKCSRAATTQFHPAQPWFILLASRAPGSDAAEIIPNYYIVKEGDFLSSIAKDNGFTDYRQSGTIPNNASLKQKRQNPNILFPGGA